MNKGTFAVQFSGAWLAGFLESWIAPTTGGKWGSADLPAGNYGSWGGTLLAIPAQSKNKEAAYKLMEFLAKNETPVLYEFKENAAFPGLVKTYDEPMFDEPMPFLGGEKARRQWATIAQNIKPITPYKADNIARAVILEQALPAVVEDGKDVEEALRDAEKLIKRRMRNL
ncbi:ABC-type sugar transport system periplasmic component [Vibrio maritimus]|uniref:ABC-type sugar transport system periplasmic component n=1 Tax=Vibrio maritimus TaxID=990268 RepID=A0A090TWB7_9VIBR|nr:ABC-type sugar transport system periplasmic component [Vibrio maritimus]